MPKSIFALLVGINNYSEELGALEGCVNDVSCFQDYLTDNQPADRLHIETLLDSEATRENIVRAFREHLCNAKKDDVVIFQYCGHGARSRTAEAFRPFYPASMSEGLVCFDSRLRGGYDLVDKELSILLSEVAKNEPQIAVILDCCHSGSATRCADDVVFSRSRMTHEITEERELETYLEGYYTRQLSETGRLVVPGSRHILLSACRKTEKAWETTHKRGLFTTCLLDVLEKSEPSISYADLFLRCRSMVARESQNQVPQFETYGQFNAYSAFLGTTTTSRSRRYPVEFKAPHWEVKCGALHGLPSSSSHPIEVELFDTSGSDSVIAKIVSVGPHSSTLDATVLGQFASESKLEAELTALPLPPMKVGIEGSEECFERVVRYFKSNESLEFIEQPAPNNYRYTIKEENGEIRLFRNEPRLVIQSFASLDESSLKVLETLFQRIQRWERLLEVENPTSQLSDEAAFCFSRNLSDGSAMETDEKYLEFGVTSEGKDSSIAGSFLASNRTKQDLHYLLLYFSEDFGIQVMFNECIEPAPEKFVIELAGHPIFNLDLTESEGDRSTHHFKLMISTTKIDDFLLAQEAIEMGAHWESGTQRGLNLGSRKTNVLGEQEWAAKTVSIRLHRKYSNDNGGDIVLAGGAVTVKAHPSFRADTSVQAIGANSRGLNQDATVHHLVKQMGGTLAKFGQARGSGGQAIEFSNIVGESALESEPLTLELDLNADDSEAILPVSYDGEHLVICGDSIRDDAGVTQVRINQLPSAKTRQRSLLRAVKLYFLKTYVKNEDVNQLRRVESLESGEIKRRQNGISENVKDANSILILIHGIIGDTYSVAKSIQTIRKQMEVDDQDPFDLVLTYDYESLHTPIAETARDFLGKMSAVGIHAEPERKRTITIVAHSMGGLISRYAIERLGASSFIDHLIMFGTPNQGSPLGEVAAARKLACFLTTIAMNAFPAIAGYGAALLCLLNRSQNLTVCLEELSPSSDFIRELNSCECSDTRYSIVAGDIQQCDENDSEWLTKLLKKSRCEGLLSQLYGGDSNDIAVSVESIKGARTNGESLKFNVACHHLNYFSSEEGLRITKQLLSHPIENQRCNESSDEAASEE